MTDIEVLLYNLAKLTTAVEDLQLIKERDYKKLYKLSPKRQQVHLVYERFSWLKQHRKKIPASLDMDVRELLRDYEYPYIK